MAPNSRFLYVLIFVVGAASLGAEIAAARLIAPFFGASTIVWANTIGVVLVALAVGYWLGGRLADRRPDVRGLCMLVIAAAILFAAVPFAARPFLDLSVDALDSVSVGAVVGSLLAVLGLVALPVMLLGAASPYAVRLAIPDVEHSGRVAGRLYAISTAGSLAGTWIAALLLIPFAGTQRTFLCFALALALVATAGLGWRFAPVPAAVALAALVPVATVGARSGERVLYEGDTALQHVRVVEEGNGDRVLELNEGRAAHSLYRPASYLTGRVWDDFLVLPLAERSRPPGRIAILGSAAGTVAREYGHFFPRTRVDAVEIDPKLTELGRRFFDLRNRRMRTFGEDARPFLRRSAGGYDAILVDAYRQPYIPFYLATREFFRLARDRLAPGGVVIVNAAHPEGSDDLEKVLGRTMADVFPTVVRDPVESTNTLLVATDGSATAARLRAASARYSRDIANLGAEVAARLGPRLAGGSVYTDDRAPVEWLIDRSILDQAR
jgi:spermidine synthase